MPLPVFTLTPTATLTPTGIVTVLVVLLVICMIVAGAFATLYCWRRSSKRTERAFNYEVEAPAEFLEGEVLQVVSPGTQETEGNAVADQTTAIMADEESHGML